VIVLPLISAKDYLSTKNGGSKPASGGGSGGGGLVSAKDYIASKKKPIDYEAIGRTEADEAFQMAHQFDNAPGQIMEQQPVQGSPSLTRSDERTDYPGGLFNPLNLLGHLANSAPLRMFDFAAGKAMGIPDDMMSSPKSTGNRIADKALEIAGGAAGFVTNPTMPVGNLSIGANFFEHPAIQRVATAAGNKAQQLLPDAGLTLSKDGTQIVDSMFGKMVNKGVENATQGALGSAAYSPFHTLLVGGEPKDYAKNLAADTTGGVILGGALGALTPAVGRAVRSLMNRSGHSIETNPDVFTQAAESGRTAPDVSGRPVNIGQDLAGRFDFIDQRAGRYSDQPLALPPSRAEVLKRKTSEPLPYGAEPIQQPGNVQVLGLPEPNVAPPTTARSEPNPWRVKFENLINVANQMDHPPGRELESLESLWSRMAGPEDPGLDELVKLAYPPPKVRSDSLSRARELQRSREAAGAPGPVKSMADRYDSGVKGEAAAPREVLFNNRTAPEVEIIPPKKESPVPNRSKNKNRQQAQGRLVTASEYKSGKNAPAEVIPVEGELGSAQTFKQRKAAGTSGEGVQHMDAGQEYAGNPIPFRQARTQNERTINRNRVVKNLRKNLKVVIDAGKLKAGRGVLGIHKVRSGVVRTRMAEDLQVISHEVGHNLDKRFNLQDQRFQNEYMALIHNNPILNVAAYKPHELPAEGVAEYVRLRLTDPDAARRIAPNFTKFFESKLDEKTLRGLEASARDIDTWITQGDFNQAVGLIDFDSGGDKQNFSWNRFYTRMVDDLNPLKLAEKALKGKLGVGADSIYKMARLSRGIGERAKLAITRGIYDDKGNKLSDGLRQILSPLKDMGVSEKQFATYLAVKHAADLKAAGKKVPFSDSQIKAVLARMDTPELQAIQQKVIGWNDALLQLMVDAQLKSAKQVQAMRKTHPNYVPFMRYFDDDAIAGFKNGGYGASKGFANVTDPVKRMSDEGSTRTIINPIESMVKNAFLVMNAAAKNKVGLQLAELAKINDAGAWVEHIGKGGAERADHIVSVWINGVRQQYKVRDPELYNALLSLDNESANSVVRFLGGAAGLLRAGATLSPAFLLRNAFRDAVGAMVNSTKYGFNPADFFFGLANVLGKTELFDRFMSSGGAMSTLMSLDREANREALQQVFQKSFKDKTLNVIKSPKELGKLLSGYTLIKGTVGALRKAAEVSELSTKVGTYRKVLKKTGSSEEAAFAARDLMDFNRAGAGIRPANRMIAFLNAGIQGIDRTARSFWGEGPKDYKTKASFLTRAVTTLVLPSIGLYIWSRNLGPEQKKVYDNIPQWQKDTFFIVPVAGTNQFARIPKPFEAGMMFATGTERMLRWMEDNDPDAFDGYARALGEAYTPPTLITAFTPIIEGMTNHSFFRDAPIIPRGEQDLEKKDQYGINTSETAKLAGHALSHVPGVSDTNFASPRIIDNTIKGFTATLGQYGVEGLDTLLQAMLGNSEAPQPSRAFYEHPPVSGFLATTNGGGQIRQDFYDKWDKLTKAKNSAEKNQQPFKDPDYGRMKAAYNIITDLNKQYKAVQKDKNLQSGDKRKKLDELDDRMNEIARKGLGKE